MQIGVGGTEVEYFMGREKSNKMVVRHREGGNRVQKCCRSWFPALWAEEEGTSVSLNVPKTFRNSGDCDFSGWMLK